MPRRSRSGEGLGTDNAARIPKRARRSIPSDRSLRDAALGGHDQSGRRFLITASEFVEKNKVLQTLGDEKEGELRVRELDCHVEENRKSHYTDQYELSCLVVRRGQAFDLSVTFDRDYNPSQDQVVLQFVTGTRPQESKGTVIRLPVLEDVDKSIDQWHATVKKTEEAVLTVTVTPSADTVIGTYHVFVETSTSDAEGNVYKNRREFDDDIIVLFNAWCSEDDVYVESEAEREEYVLNESGRLWQGTRTCFNALPWNFGQFDDVCLEAALYLLDKAELASTARANPVLVVRAISAMANSNDEDGGVLTGRWTDTYPKGSTEPWAWTGSVAILEQFMKRKKAVNFGQCWVFSGLVTTLLRALGIPTRSVTNFDSAHDSDASMTIDFHWSEEDETLDELNDSVWNFHVWNESYLRRPDLPEGYGGWQAHDATPQEASEGVMRCGPASVKAIKQGHVYLPYDASFVFAEVNGDKVHWLVKEDGSMEPIYKERDVIGANISTKAIGSTQREDVTHDYKFGEGSEEERKAVHGAFRYGTRREHAVYDIPEPDVTFSLETPTCVPIGDDFTIKVKMTNTKDEARNVQVRLSAVMSYYTGVSSEKVASESFKGTVEANGESEFTLSVSADDYLDSLKPEACIQVYLRGNVLETKRGYAHIESFSLFKPGVDIQVPETAALGEEFDLVMKFTNPLKEKLTNVEFHVEAPGIVKALTVPHKKAVGPGEEVEETVTLSARRAGKKEIIVRVSSSKLKGMTGTAEITIKYSE